MTGKLIRSVDLETTGLEPPDAEIIEIGVTNLLSDGAGYALGSSGSTMFNSARPSPPEVLAVHHILPGHLEGLPLCQPATLTKLCTGTVAIAAHNAAFEGLFFTEELRAGAPLLCTYKAALRVWPDAPGHSNQVLRYWLGIDLDPEQAMPPHRAGPDAFVTAHILLKLLDQATVEQMVAWTLEPCLLPRCPIGKFRGKPWAEVETGFLTWMTNQADMEGDLKWNARRELERRRTQS